MKEKTYLGKDGLFVTEEEYSEFVRTEIVVNAVTHRDYAIKGTDIQIKMFSNRLEVDSPGTLPGMVNKENIRFTHFSRNPKIAAFLKDYRYVKEYGEGIDRMCRELEAIGLPNPVFNNSTFILKTTVMSADRAQRAPGNAMIGNQNAMIGPKNAMIGPGNAMIGPGNAMIDPENAMIGNQNAMIGPKNAMIEPGNAMIGNQNAMIGPKNAMIDPGNAMIGNQNAMIGPENAMIDKSNSWNHAKKMWIDHVNKLYDKGVMTAITSSSIIAILEDLQEDQVIGTKDVQKVLDCKDTKARQIISEMKKTKIIIAITGQGKGKYTLNIL